MVQINICDGNDMCCVCLQIFDKALDEPKYSFLYAQLCKRLSESAPNFDPPDVPCTFVRLLLKKCKDEFDNRSHANQVSSLHLVIGPMLALEWK